MNAQAQPKVTYAEYLAREAVAEAKHDFVDGVIYERGHGTSERKTIEHGALQLAFARHLGNALGAQAYRPLGSDVRVKVRATGASFYPDVTVVCRNVETPADEADAVTNPVVVVEVLSPNTEAYDRGAKAAHYRRIESLREYVLVSQSERRIEVQRLNERGVWELHFFGPGERVELTSLSCTISVDDVYANPLG